MVGFAVYGAVQAHLKQPVTFPGDYLAWDREMCQSQKPFFPALPPLHFLYAQLTTTPQAPQC